MPKLYGKLPDKKEIFYLAADEIYFNRHAKTCITSIKCNFDISIHIHLYNPSQETKNWCDDKKISYSYEIFDTNSVNMAFEKYSRPVQGSKMNERQEKMVRSSENKTLLKELLIKTYYACTRFVRLGELLDKPKYIIMLDCDSLVRMPFVLPTDKVDIHIHEKSHLRWVPYKTHLASTIFYTGTDASLQLIKQHAELIKQEYYNDTFYWFLDQESLDIVIQKYKKSKLSRKFVDYLLGDVSFIWCGKGSIKDNAKWIAEQTNYNVE